MKIKWSGIAVVDGRGKINGSVASKNRSGAYMRTKVTPVNPQTSAQVAARNVLSNFSQAWSGITQAARDAWNSAVGDFQTTDIFGDLRSPTGKNLYTKLNANLVSVGLAAIGVPPLPSSVPSLSITSLDIAIGAVQFDATFTGDNAAVSYQVWATPGVSPGVSFVKSEYRQIGAVAGGGGSPYDFSADYIAKYGNPAVGTKVFVKMVPVNATTGQKGLGSEGSTIVLA